MEKILFVCTGNTCRSPMAAGILNLLLKKGGSDNIVAESAGIAAKDGEPASENAVKAAALLGVDLVGHRARTVDARLVEESAQIYVMSAGHKAALERLFPKLRGTGKVRVLGGGVSDPYGGSLAEYVVCRDALLRELIVIAGGLLHG